MARRQKLIEERDALLPSCSNASFTETNRKMNGILDKLMALNAVGGQQVLSDSDMTTAVNSLHAAMDRWEGDIPGTSAWLAGEGGSSIAEQEAEAFMQGEKPDVSWIGAPQINTP